MSMFFSIIGVICGIFILSAAGILFAKHDEDDIIITSIIIFLAGVILVFLITLSGIQEETLILDKNIDHNKTKIIEVNNKPTELYITVNGEEYHFTFEEVPNLTNSMLSKNERRYNDTWHNWIFSR